MELRPDESENLVAEYESFEGSYGKVNEVLGSESYQGLIALGGLRRTEDLRFFELLREGVQVRTSLGVDFSTSNGDPRGSSSLHYVSARPNQYQQVF